MSIIGPVTVMDSFLEQFGKHSPVIHGILVSSILLSAAVGSFFAGRPADVLGRPRAIALGASVFTLGAVLQAGAVSLPIFAVGRVCEGLGYGLYFGTQTVYICEIAPVKLRGPLTTGPQFMTCLALVVGFFTSYGTVHIPGSLSWRLPFILNAGLAGSYVLVNLFLLPESPRWLILRGRRTEAEKVYDKLGVKLEDRQFTEEADSATSQDPALALRDDVGATEEERRKKNHAGFKDVWSRHVRKQTFLAVFLMGFLQLCGIDAVLYVRSVLVLPSFIKFSKLTLSFHLGSMRRYCSVKLVSNPNKQHFWSVPHYRRW